MVVRKVIKRGWEERHPDKEKREEGRARNMILKGNGRETFIQKGDTKEREEAERNQGRTKIIMLP